MSPPLLLALEVRGGRAVLENATVAHHLGGGLLVDAGGSLEVTDSLIYRNGNSPEASFGGLMVQGHGTVVNLVATRVSSNGQRSGSCPDSAYASVIWGNECVRGGGLRLRQGHVSMSAGTAFQHNVAFEGSSILIESTGVNVYRPSLMYTLPAPLGHYIIITNRGLTSRLVIPGESLVVPFIDDDFPYLCSAGKYGNQSDHQTSPRCGGSCPAGHYCPPATVHPIRCSKGTFCEEGSAVETPCAAGFFGGRAGLQSASECERCPAGTHCPRGSSQPIPCPPGSYTSASGLAFCTQCSSGTYQGVPGQTSCVGCPPGHFCEQGAASYKPCEPGTHALRGGLNSSNQCVACPNGRYCEGGTVEPSLCPAGTRGAGSNAKASSDCLSCSAPTYSTAGSKRCATCIQNYYAVDGDFGASAAATDQCKLCPLGSSCTDSLPAEGFHLANIVVSNNHWRLGAKSSTIYKCQVSQSDGKGTSCKGGSDAGTEGDGYCAAGHYGPLCQLCIQPGNSSGNSGTTNESIGKAYFDEWHATCKICPDVRDRISWVLIAILFATVAVGALVLILRYKPTYWLPLINAGRRLWINVTDHALMPKLKILMSLYQSICAIPKVYGVVLSPWYERAMQPISWIQIRWDVFVIPGSCLPGGFLSRLLLRGLAPYLLVIVVIIAHLLLPAIMYLSSKILRQIPTEQLSTPMFKKLASSAERFLEQERNAQIGLSCFRRLMNALPFTLFVLFVFCPTVSEGIFQAFDCVAFEVEESSSGRLSREFLRTDLTIECASDKFDVAYAHFEAEKYPSILFAAWAFIFMWPILVPVLFVLTLLPVRRHLFEKRNTRLVRATAFLHKEYHVRFAFIMPVSCSQRCTRAQMVPLTNRYARAMLHCTTACFFLLGVNLYSAAARLDRLRATATAKLHARTTGPASHPNVHSRAALL